MRKQAKLIIRRAIQTNDPPTLMDAFRLANKIMNETGLRRAFWETLTPDERLVLVREVAGSRYE